MSDSKKDRDPNDPSDRPPPRLRERSTATTSPEPDRQALSVRRPLDDSRSPRRTFTGNEGRGDKSSDEFAEAMARLMREQPEVRRYEVPSVLQRRPLLSIGQMAIAVASAAVVTLAYVTLSSSQGVEGSALQVWQSMTATMLTSPPSRRASALLVRNVSGFVNEPLQLGVTVESPDPGATVALRGMPADARLTAGVPTSLGEWRVSADEISRVKIIPPSDFVGEMNVSAELHNVHGAALVTGFLQFNWKPIPATNPPPAPTATASIAPTQQAASPPATAGANPPQPPAPAPAETAHQLTANETAALVRRAEEILAFGDVREARLLLIRAAEAHDGRAALILAKTFDPTVAKQIGTNLAQARGWYQKAREWGSPDAQRQLDALASYR